MAVLPFHTPFVPIMDWIVNQLATWPSLTAQGITEYDVLEVASDNVPYTRPDAEILVRAGEILKTEHTGHGRRERRIYRRLYVTVRTRLNVDEPDRAQWWLSDPNLGYVALEEAVLDALDTQFATSLVDNSTTLTYKPILWDTGSRPSRTQENGWGEGQLHFTVPYILNYSINYPPGVE